MSQTPPQYDTRAAQQFCDLLADNPKLVQQSSEQLQAQLHDALRDFPTEAYIIWQAYRHGAAELLDAHNTTDALAQALADSLTQACGMQQPAIDFAGYAWAKTLISGFGQATPDDTLEPEAEDQSPTTVTDIDIPNPELLPSVGDKKRMPTYTLPEGFEMTEDFEAAFEFVETTKQHLMLTGKAGTGKSTWLHYFALHTSKEFVVLAPTGVAAVKIGAQTIHSFFGFPPRAMMPADPDIRLFGKNHPTREIIKHADTIIIDEISMVRADMLDAIDTALRKNTGFKSLPFGGKQIVMIGDLHQLPPVVGKNELDKQLYPAYAKPSRGDGSPIQDQAMLFGQHYDTPYFFSANVLQAAPLNVIQLHTIFRQHDDAFISMLNRIRNGDRNAEMLRKLNKRLNPNFVPENDDFIITLVPTNAAAKKLNDAAMARLPDSPVKYRGDIDGEFERSRLPTDFNLELKVGAQVMFVRNDPARRWVNGSIGTVTELDDEFVMVANADGEELTVTRYTWENTRYSWNKQQKVVETDTVGTFTQFPLQLAWAVTIHKSQGLTFERVVVDLGRGAFAHGQTYVALSRCRSLEGLILKTRVKASDILLDPNVLEFTQEWEDR